MNALSGVDSLTPREREVLNLVAKGRTNGEIADALGISFDTVKWHVSEILSKLPAESREEAAERWRRHNGLAPRFERIFRGIAGGASLKWAAGVVVVIAGVGLAGTLILVAVGGDEDSPAQAPGTPTMTPSPTAEVTASATSAPGLSAGSFRIDSSPALPTSSIVYTVTGCWGCDGPDTGLVRHMTSRGGQTISEAVLEPGVGVLEGWKLGGVAGSSDGSRLAALVCDLDYCGPWIAEWPEGEFRLLWSSDGGTSWDIVWSGRYQHVMLGRQPLDGGALLAAQRWTSAPDGTRTLGDQEFFAVTAADSQQLRPPSEAGRWGWPHLLRDGSVLWSAYDDNHQPGGLLNDDGNPARFEVPADANVLGVSQATRRVAVLWGRPAEAVATLSMFDLSGAPIDEFKTEGVYSFSLLSDELALGNLSHQSLGGGALPSFFDLSTSSATVLAHADYLNGGRNRFVAYQHGFFARVVNTDGDCLNLREAPSPTAPIVTCVPEGVIMYDRDEVLSPDGPAFQKVRTLAGQEGWASVEFLNRF